MTPAATGAGYGGLRSAPTVRAAEGQRVALQREAVKGMMRPCERRGCRYSVRKVPRLDGFGHDLAVVHGEDEEVRRVFTFDREVLMEFGAVILQDVYDWLAEVHGPDDYDYRECVDALVVRMGAA